MVKMVFTDDELNKSAQLSARQDFLGSFIRLKRVWEFTRERGSVQNFQNFLLTVDFFCSRKVGRLVVERL